MTRRKKPRSTLAAHVWVQVRARLFCALGGHDVPAGGWVRFRRGDYRRMASCEPCLAKAGVYRPARSFTMVDDGPDAKARQSGGDE